MGLNRFHKPIGVYNYNYDNMRNALSMNIGNNEHEYDKFGSIIGGLSNPYSNSMDKPWFFTDQYKNMYSDYISYMRGIYSSKLSSDSLLEKTFSLSLGDRAGVQLISFYNDDSVGVVSAYDIVGSFNGMINTNPNYIWLDSKLGETNNYFLSHTLMRAAALNNVDAKSTTNITSSLPYDLGLSLSSVDNITSRYLFDNRGKINIMTNFGVMSPLDDTNWGNYGYISNSVYSDFYNTLSPLSQSFYMKSMNGIDLMSDVEINLDINNLTNFRKLYLSDMIGNNGIKITKVNTWYHIFKNLGNETYENGYLFEYAEENKNVGPKYPEFSNKHGVSTNRYKVTPDASVKDLVAFTNAQFKTNEEYRTLISRFHTEQSVERYEKSEIETAISRKYGLSMGRNLLRLDHETTHKDEIYNGYSNPYCRVWTYHYQYNKLLNTIRPFFKSSNENDATLLDQSMLSSEYNWGTMRSINRKMNDDGSYEDWMPDGGTRLKKYGVTNNFNGLVNITPVAESKDIYEAIRPEQCMFSIENLAWKDMYIKNDPEHGLSEGEIGPNGGRIMWFPPYNITFNENVNVNWTPTSFIGRGENIYSYVNTERSGTLSFTILADHPSILNYWEHKNKTDESEGDVDDVKSHEQEILRFFAGCSILKAKEPTIVEKYIPPKEETPKPKPNIIPQETRTFDKELVFYVFYPNNYSGVDDKPNSEVSAMEYLANGFGCQKYRTSNNTVEDFPTNINQIAKFDNSNFGGYEMRRYDSYGCSMVNKNIATCKTNFVINKINYGNEEITAVTNYVTRTNKHWFYRVDKRVENEILKVDNYVDSESFGLNSNEGYKDLLNIFSDETEDNLVSFTDMFVALDNEFKNTLDSNGDSYLYDEANVSLIQEILSTYRIKQVYASGFASSHGYTSSNNILNKNRAQSVVNWLQSYEAFKKDGIECAIDITDIGNVGKIQSVSEFQPKVYRSAKIVITYEVEEVIDLKDDASETNIISETNVRSGEFTVKQDRYLFNDNKNPFYSNNYNPNFNINGSLYNKATLERVPIDLTQIQEFTNNAKYDIQNIYNQSLINQLSSDNTNGKYVKQIDGNSVRYSDEERFFMLLKDNDPFLHYKITEKIKYFDPAFHSITPEGFNARLTFLHQCTRQGATISESDNRNDSTATNLAFGRPPVCVLRIGDQYNTKIIIDSMTIDFGDMQWDLNAEGIGVQQMLANVTLSFKFLGGSDLAGAISRLQNALSFNYYANTGVYDNRADMIEKSDDGTIRMKCFK